MRNVRNISLAAWVAIAALAAAPVAATPSFLWKVTSNRGTLYLAGSVHMLSKDYYPLSPAFESAFNGSSLLVEEVDFADVLSPDSQLLMLRRGMLPGGQSLEGVVSADTFTLVSQRLTDLGMPIGPLKRFKPWALALTLLGIEWQQSGFDPGLGLDRHFYDRAVAKGTTFEALETIEFQISRFDGLTAEEQDRLLASTVRDLDTQKQSLGVLANAWRSGDRETVERIVLENLKDEPRLYERLLVERNRNWLPRIEALFTRPGPAFVVVGAAHLIGPDGLLTMLRDKGYVVDQL